MNMDALSPRSTNMKVRPKMEIKSKALKKTTEAAPSATKETTSNVHTPPPPSVLLEPGEDGESYVTGRFLGRGGFAVCYEGTLARNGKVFAMKVVKSEMENKKMQDKFRTELQIHSKMRHPNIVQFYRAFSFENNTYVVLELCPNGSIMEIVRKRGGLSLPEVRRFMVQLCGAVKYLHQRNVAHRDLKMGNLFLDQSMDIKVGDFGLAAVMATETEVKRRRTLCGTPNYIAPEVLDKRKLGHTQKVDIWSLGVICFAMLTSYPPFQSKTQEEIYKKVRSLTYVWPNDSDCVNQIPEEAKSLVSSCLSLAEEERPEPDDIVEHSFFNMYDGCIPAQLDPGCRFAKPVWLTRDEPRGDSIISGYSLAFDQKYQGLVEHISSLTERYRLCRDAFYTACGVGRKPNGMIRKTVGKHSSKSCYAECVSEEEKGLQPQVPLYHGYVYKYPHNLVGDWSMQESSGRSKVDAVSDSVVLPTNGRTSLKSNIASLPPTHMALSAAQQRRKDSQSHAATLRQRAVSGRAPVNKLTETHDGVPPSAARTGLKLEDGGMDAAAAPTGGFAERPIRTKRGIVPSYSASLRELSNVPTQLPKSTSFPNVLMIGKTRSKSRELEAANQHESAAKSQTSSAVANTAPLPKRSQSLRSVSSAKSSLEDAERKAVKETNDQRSNGLSEVLNHGVSQSSNKAFATGDKARSPLGISPLFHSSDKCDLLPNTSLDAVNSRIKVMLTNMVPRSDSSRGPRSKRAPHSYVIKWVDYTNRYGIGYVLDDGSVGCVFRAMNGRPASSVVVRDLERHIRRRARRLKESKASGSDTFCYESQQLVPQDGKPIEFYEECTEGPIECRGILQALICPSTFEVKKAEDGASAPAIKLRSGIGPECSRSDAEKIKRVKLVDQFGKYMIGSLGRGTVEEQEEDGKRVSQNTGGQFIKFYQRLGNVGVWGFGDGAFQFNFPDHTKLVISPGPSKDSSPWIDFYHLSPSAARFLAETGKMHPSGFDTRVFASDEAVTFINIARNNPTTTAQKNIHNMLSANLFMRKIGFIRDVFKGWMKCGRLGGRPVYRPSASGAGHVRLGSELYWEGPQEFSDGGAKFVWVTVGTPGGDGEYVSAVLTPEDIQNSGKHVRAEKPVITEAITEQLRSLRTESSQEEVEGR